MADPFTGEIRIWANNFAPEYWAFCDGQQMHISQNPTLYAIIGTLYGGDGRVYMSVPHLKGRAPMHWGQSPGLSNYDIGELGGSNTISLDESQLPSHDHDIVGYRAASTTETPSSTVLYARAINPSISGVRAYHLSDGNLTSMQPEAIGISGASVGHENRQPLLSINFCIALYGTFPSRN